MHRGLLSVVRNNVNVHQLRMVIKISRLPHEGVRIAFRNDISRKKKIETWKKWNDIFHRLSTLFKKWTQKKSQYSVNLSPFLGEIMSDFLKNYYYGATYVLCISLITKEKKALMLF